MPLPSPSSVADLDLSGVSAWLAEHHADMVEDLREYVSIETPSTDRDALRAGLDWLRGYLDRRLGPPVTAEVRDGGTNGDILVAAYAGGGVGSTRLPVVALCHYDTVWDVGTLAERPFTVAGDTITGPGVFDMKAGLVQAVWSLLALRAAGLDHPSLRLLLNGDEETGSQAARPVIEEVCRDAEAVLVFEAAADGAVKTARKGVGIWTVELAGLESHAGLDPAKGVSAVDALARVTVFLHGLTDLAAGTSVNVGVVSGGTRTNVVAGHAMGGIDVRVSSAAEAERIDSALADLAARAGVDPRVTLTLHGEWNRPVMERTPRIAAMYDLTRAVGARLGLDLREVSVGGASDGNFAAVLGCGVLDGIGALGDGAHAQTEYASAAGMVERSALTAGVLAALGRAD